MIDTRECCRKKNRLKQAVRAKLTYGAYLFTWGLECLPEIRGTHYDTTMLSPKRRKVGRRNHISKEEDEEEGEEGEEEEE